MNKQFMIKMLQAKQLEYEALKEILPEPVVTKITDLEKDLIDLGKEYFMTVLGSEKNEKTSSESGAGARARKVTIE